MARIKKVEPLVYAALTDNPSARTDDFILVAEVYKNFITDGMRLIHALENHALLGLPSFASIIRIRRKLQTKYPHLVNEKTAEMRTKAESDYKGYALNSK